jgi:LmbE family N-acetylglucosaminyl deacetylase
MSNNLRLLAVLAHPDDESLGNGGMLARYAAEGVETYLITATRGEQGWFGDPAANPGPEALGRIRETELRAAVRVLGIREVTFLDYLDGELDLADRDEVVAKIAAEVRRIQPDVVVTFDPAGLYGHPDHIAICPRHGRRHAAAGQNMRAAAALASWPSLLHSWTDARSRFTTRPSNFRGVDGIS